MSNQGYLNHNNIYNSGGTGYSASSGQFGAGGHQSNPNMQQQLQSQNMGTGYPSPQIISSSRLQPQQPQGLLYGKGPLHHSQMPLMQNSQMMYNVLQSQTLGSSSSQISGLHHTKQLEGAQRARLAGTQAHHHARVAASQQRLINNLGGSANSGSGQLNSNVSVNQNQTGQTLGSHTSLASNASEVNGNIPTLKPSLAAESSSWTALDMGGMMINQLHPGLFSYKFLTALYLNHNNLTSIPPIISQLGRLSVLNLSGNKLATLPVEIGLMVSLKELLLYDNLLTFIPAEYGQLYQLEMLGLEGNPMNEPIASMIMEKGTSIVVKYLRDSCPLPPPPADREWIEIEETNTASAQAFTVMCYNTLCEKYVSPQYYGYTPSWALSWDYRKDLLIQEILNYSADIICLQEVDMKQYEEFFSEQLAQHGDYEGQFFAKSRSRTMGEYERRQVDGCAILYKNSKFILLEKQHIEFQQIAMQRPDLHRSEDVLNRVMIKDNIAVVVLLESKDDGSKIIVSNAHLHWDPLFSDVKVIQTALLIDEVQKASTQWARKYNYPTQLPVIFCGDFNSLPNSGVVELLSKGSISSKHQDLQNYNYQPFTDKCLSHSFNLKSAYSLTDDIDFTNFTPMFKGIIDYIWYDTSSLITTGILGGIDKQYASKIVGFPNPHHPSDHIPLVVSLRHNNKKQ